MEKTWKPMVAGILTIVAGISLFGITSRMSSPNIPSEFPVIGPAIILVIALPFFIIWALAIAGGIFSLKYKVWGMALAGSIAATIIVPFLGVPALVFIALSKDEFE